MTIDFAFVSSPLPVVLSIENHCSLSQQRKMAAIFRQLLADKLVSTYLIFQLFLYFRFPLHYAHFDAQKDL